MLKLVSNPRPVSSERFRTVRVIDEYPAALARSRKGRDAATTDALAGERTCDVLRCLCHEICVVAVMSVAAASSTLYQCCRRRHARTGSATSPYHDVAMATPITSARRLSQHNVRCTGRGDRAIVFAHGFGCDQQMWRFVAPAFEKDWRVVLFDHAGAGPAAPAAYDQVRHATLDGYADDLVAIAEALDLHEAVLVGHSVSATIAMLAAIAAPARFGRLVLVGPTPCYLNDPPSYTGGFTPEQLDGLLTLMADNYTAWADALAPTIVGAVDAPGDAGDTARARSGELRDSICAMAPDVALAFARATFLEDHRATVPRVPIPSLILQSSEDAIAPASVGAWLAAHLPQSTFHQLAAVGHCPHMTQPEEVIQAIEGYLGATDLAPAFALADVR